MHARLPQTMCFSTGLDCDNAQARGGFALSQSIPVVNVSFEAAAHVSYFPPRFAHGIVFSASLAFSHHHYHQHLKQHTSNYTNANPTHMCKYYETTSTRRRRMPPASCNIVFTTLVVLSQMVGVAGRVRRRRESSCAKWWPAGVKAPGAGGEPTTST